MNNGIWLLILPGTLFLLMFVLELFLDGVFAKKNRATLTMLAIFLIINFSLITVSTFNNSTKWIDANIIDVILYVGYGLGGITFLITFLIQCTAAFKLIRKIPNRSQRTGILFIGLAGVFFMANAITELLEQVISGVEFFSVIGTILSLVASVAMYLGYIHPSTQERKA
jgi:hypothetical protein